MLSSVHKKFGYAPRDILRDTKIDTRSFVADGTLKEEHTKLFQRIDNLVETEKLRQEAVGLTVFDCSEIPDKSRREQEIELLHKCEPIKSGIFKKIQPRIINPLD
jgi:hypothetical protein